MPRKSQLFIPCLILLSCLMLLSQAIYTQAELQTNKQQTQQTNNYSPLQITEITDYSIESYSIEIIDSASIISIRAAGEDINLQIPADAKAVEITPKTDFAIKDNLLVIKNPLKNNLTIKYLTKSLINQNTLLLELPEPTNLRITLPEKAILGKSPSAIPEPRDITTNGRILTLSWNMERFSSSKAVFVRYELPKKGQTLQWIWIIIIIFIIGIIAAFAYPKFKRRQKKEKTHLLEDEKLIVNALEHAKNNELWQKELQFKTSLTKVKLSRKLRSLEQRNIIEKIPLGNTNKIRLK